MLRRLRSATIPPQYGQTAEAGAVASAGMGFPWGVTAVFISTVLRFPRNQLPPSANFLCALDC